MFDNNGILSFNYINKALNLAPGKPSLDKILQIGPGGHTFEISLRLPHNGKYGQPADGSDKGPPLLCCQQCQYRLICARGKEIQNGNLEYRGFYFDKVILLADSGLPTDAEIEKSLGLLNAGGHIIMFVQYAKSNELWKLCEPCFSDKKILPQINQNQVEIVSISNFTTICSHEVMCLIGCKKYAPKHLPDNNC